MPTNPTATELYALATTDDPYPLLATLREASPVLPVAGTDFHLVATWELVQEALQRTEDFSSNLRSVMSWSADGTLVPLPMDAGGSLEQVLATADGDVHRQHRPLVMKSLAKRIRALDEEAGQVGTALWDQHVGDGQVDWVSAMADRLPLVMLGRLIGLPDEDLPLLMAWAYDTTEMLSGLMTAERARTAAASSAHLISYLQGALAAARTNPQDDVIGSLAEQVNSGELHPDTAAMILLQLVGAGGESTAGLIASATRFLAEDPELQARLRADPDLVDAFLDECLRLESPFRGHYRHVPHTTELGGVELPAGSNLMLLWSAANRDPLRFPDPDRLDLERPGMRQHLAFGRGAHFCLGSALARSEATASLRVLLSRTESFALDPDQAPRRVPSIFVRRHATLPLLFVPA